GAGRNRNEIDHYGNEVLALCRSHHSEQHQIGIDSFNEKYHLDEWIKVDERLNAMLKGRKYE
ncbi:putative HNHc nuclease, partial [Macrococcoides caseolyticum]